MSEVRANQLAKQLIDEQKGVDANNNIAFVIAKVLPLIKPEQQQQQVYQLLVEASASMTVTNANLSLAVRRVKELTEEVKELNKRLELTSGHASVSGPEPEEFEIVEEAEHEPS
ncbi:hypothetical protein [Vibrio cyclitrophicus]|uniref:hypothetical protein n=1 Tax=Vibrio cyclitrophicus TaxID=47951 RepID=UPI000377B770|nr:hypothetical protein [Vibrio cyclitrophicus]OEF47872.1 hypothetical protein OAC_18365 [Vibrio cyclitrophicus 1F273]